MTTAQEQALWDFVRDHAAHWAGGTTSVKDTIESARVLLELPDLGALSVSGEAPPKEERECWHGVPMSRYCHFCGPPPKLPDPRDEEDCKRYDREWADHCCRWAHGGSAPPPESGSDPGNCRYDAPCSMCAPPEKGPRPHEWTREEHDSGWHCLTCGAKWNIEGTYPDCAAPKEPPAPMEQHQAEIARRLKKQQPAPPRTIDEETRAYRAGYYNPAPPEEVIEIDEAGGVHGDDSKLRPAPSPETRSVEEILRGIVDRHVMRKGTCAAIFLALDAYRAEKEATADRIEHIKAMAEQEINAWKHWAEGVMVERNEARNERDARRDRKVLCADLEARIDAALALVPQGTVMLGTEHCKQLRAALRGGKVD